MLFVGNVAGNAYLNAKFLRRYGIEVHVLSADYYYPIGSPEWEDGTRPDWFAQGPIGPCARYLHALLDRRNVRAAIAWRLMRDAAMTASGGTASVRKPHSSTRAQALASTFNEAFERANRALATGFWSFRGRIALWRFRLAHKRSYAWNLLHRTVLLRLASPFRRHRSSRRLRAGLPPPPPPLDPTARARADFDRFFPSRPDRLTAAEVSQWLWGVEPWERLLSRYDVVQGYGSEVIRTYMAGGRPYVGYEHGTLRDFTMGDDVTHRMCALGYRAADHVFITNGDCLEYARRLGITEYTPMIHPLDVEQYRRQRADEVAAIRRELDVDVVLFCPLRHDWAIKGTDVHLRALPLIRAANPDLRFATVLTRWGAQVGESEALLAELGCADLVRWVEPLEREEMIAYMQAADVVLDQIALPHFGATAPQAIAAGTPVVMSYRPESTAWIVGEPAPILPAFEPADVAAAVQTALDPDWRSTYRQAAARWTRRWHHPDRIVLDHCRTYRRLLEA